MKYTVTFEIENETEEDQFINAGLMQNQGLSLFEKLAGNGKAKVEIKVGDRVYYTEEIED